MSGILFLAHRLPFPPDRGDKIRSHHVLKALAESWPVHVGCLAETSADLRDEPQLAAIAESWCMPKRRKPAIWAGLEAIASGVPVSLAAFHDGELQEWVRSTLETERIDTIYVFSGQMGQYVPPEWQGRVIVDLVDVDSAKFDALAETASWPMSWIYRREGLLLRKEEARLVERADRTLLVSEAEASLLKSRLLAQSVAKLSVLQNGVDTVRFNPEASSPHPEISGSPGPHFVFTGQMDYPPNEEAVLYVIDEILPRIQQVHQSAQFHVVGRAPRPKLMRHDGQNGCRIWGEVPDTRPFLAAADVVLAPLHLARGVQNKVLEAMAMARPVLLTSAAAQGIPAHNGEHFLIVNDADEVVEKALLLLANGNSADAMGNAARRFVLEQMSWPAALSALPELLGQSTACNGQLNAA